MWSVPGEYALAAGKHGSRLVGPDIAADTHLQQLDTLWMMFLILVPLVHLGAVVCTKQFSAKRSVAAALLFPLAGGPRTFVFQVLSWVRIVSFV